MGVSSTGEAFWGWFQRFDTPWHGPTMLRAGYGSAEPPRRYFAATLLGSVLSEGEGMAQQPTGSNLGY